MTKFRSRGIAGIISTFVECEKSKIDLNCNITAAEYKRRWQVVQKAMKSAGYELAYLCGSELDRSDVAYLTGFFDPIIERYGLLMPAKGSPIILAGSEGGEVAAEAAARCGADVAILQDYQIADADYRHAKWSTFQDVLRNVGAKSAGRLAILSPAEVVPHTHIAMLEGTCGPENVVYDTLLLQLIKYEKSDAELKIGQYCNIIADAAFRAMLAVLRPGVRELEVAGAGDAVMRLLGARRNGFPTIVTSGPRQFTVIGPATNRVIRRGDTVSLGLSPCFNGYHGVVRRTVGCGVPMKGNAKALCDAVEQAYRVTWKAIVEVARKNKPSNWIDTRYKSFLTGLKLKNKFGKYVMPLEPYSCIHNMGCSECQEGYGAVTPYTTEPLGKKAMLAIDVALLGFVERGRPLFDCPYAVVEDAFWKIGSSVGIYNNLPLDCQPLVGNLEVAASFDGNPYHKKLPL